MKLSPKLIAVLRRLLLGGAGLATALALFVALENWRGDRAWAAYQREMLARGDRFDFAAFQPIPVPDADNLFKAPLLAHLLYERADDPERKRLLAAARLSDFTAVSRFSGKPEDFPKLRDALKQSRLLAAGPTDSPAAEVLAALQPLRPLLDDLRDAAPRRPKAALEARATPQESPQLAVDTIYHLSQALAVRAAAELELGRIDDAHADLFALQRLANGFAAHPGNLLHLLVGTAMHGLAAGVISTGCERHAWSDDRLVEFQTHLDALQPLAGFKTALKGERAFGLYAVDLPAIMKAYGWPFWLFHGWAQQNKVRYCQLLETEILAKVSEHPGRILPLKSFPAAPRPTTFGGILSPYDFLSRLSLTNFDKILGGLGESVDRLELHATAWAIERHRLAHGHVPEDLTALVPEFLATVPQGVFDGQAFRFTKLPGGGVRLHSSGKNARDDGGEGDDPGVVIGGAR